MAARYFLSRDDSGHWYLVPADRRADWEPWANLDEDDEASWTPPGWARRVNGAPSQITFENWDGPIVDEPEGER
jgi:hypothetical protein